MLTRKDIEKIINDCREAGENGLGSGCKATIQELTLDFLVPPMDFLGVGKNPAIFINQATYNLLGRFHKNWEPNKTIAVKEDFLSNDPITVIGVIIHETGHAFNVAANIENTEANAYVFEIEIISRWCKTKDSLLFDCPEEDIQSFFESRLSYYHKETNNHDYLASLVAGIEQNKTPEQSAKPPEPETNKESTRFVVPTPKLSDSNPTAFFRALSSNLTEEQRKKKRVMTDECVIL